ncbi:MAG: GMC family oxidoreductase [Gemmatimonadota bacterium]|nr:GMC family oxidoreductase [Gemmatimonadota bacterium]
MIQKSGSAGSRSQPYDAIVVGSGISGGWAAKELAEKGLRVLLLERGPNIEHRKYPTEWMQPWQFAHRGRGDRPLYEEEYPIQSQCYAFGEATQHLFVNDREHPYLAPEEKPFRWIRGYHLGGRSLMWGRQVYRWSDLDFEANLRDGHGVDWPIRYKDVAPWYSHVERFIGVSGEKRGLPHLPDGEFLPPWELNCAETALKEGVEGKFPGRVVTPGRVTNLTRDHNGRVRCQARSQCERGCSFGAYFSSLSSTLPAAHATGNLTLVTDAIVESVLFDEQRGRAAGVRVIDRETKQDREYFGRLVFLCASTIATTQIMLNSKSRRFPDGIANSSGVLGHYLMDHPFQAGATGKLPGMEDQYYYGRRPNGIYIPRFRNLRGGDSDGVGFVRGYGYQGSASRSGWGRGAWSPGIGVQLKEKLRQPGPWEFWLGAWGEMLPREENHVALDPVQKDQWGIPLLRISCSWSDNERKMMADGAAQAAAMLEAAGCTDVSAYNNLPPPGFCIHEMGTARMGRDPKTSVLNAYNQAHDVPNLFVTDGACMASSANQNPSITYMALTARAADYAVGEMKRGNL